MPSPSTPTTVSVWVDDHDDTLTVIHDDELVGLYAEGDTRITRASHVEPGDPAAGQHPQMWYADMSPVHGPTLGGFCLRANALAAERDWLEENLGKE
jgi:hypothetical protein